eukprot:5218568-Amphidinium_carterae.1
MREVGDFELYEYEVVCFFGEGGSVFAKRFVCTHGCLCVKGVSLHKSIRLVVPQYSVFNNPPLVSFSSTLQRCGIPSALAQKCLVRPLMPNISCQAAPFNGGGKKIKTKEGEAQR